MLRSRLELKSPDHYDRPKRIVNISVTRPPSLALPHEPGADNIHASEPNQFKSEEYERMSFKKTFLIGVVVLALAIAALAQGRGTTEVTIKGKKISIDYGKPPLGTHSVSELPVGGVWRVGMNEATRIDTAGGLVIAGKPLAAGSYTLWVKRVAENSWVLAFHPKTQAANGKPLWGAPPQTSGFVAELPLKLETAKDSADPLVIALSDKKGIAWVSIHWGTSMLSGSIHVQ